VGEFEKGLLRELDFREELSNLFQARKLLDPERSLTVPRPYPELSCKTVLTMQLFPGRSLRRLEPGSEAAKRAVEEILHGACKQVFIDGFFHGDPHAGNLLVDEHGTICMVDLGLMGHLTETQRDDLVALIFATLTNDSGAIARVILRMGTPTQRVNLAELRAEIERIRGRYLEVSTVAQLDSAGFAQAFVEAARHFRIKLGSEYSILTRATTELEGLVRSLYPEVDMLAIARPYVQQALARRLAPVALMQSLAGEASGLASLARGLPAQLDQILHDVESGSFQVRVVTPELDSVPGFLHQLAGRLALASFAATLSICAAIVLPPGDAHWLRWVLFGALVLGAAGAWSVLLGWQVVGRGKPFRLTPLLRLFRR
jgi:ubiquinone biosynthesis protein